MSEVKKVSIHSTLWTEPIKIVRINDVVLNKIEC